MLPHPFVTREVVPLRCRAMVLVLCAVLASAAALVGCGDGQQARTKVDATSAPAPEGQATCGEKEAVLNSGFDYSADASGASTARGAVERFLADEKLNATTLSPDAFTRESRAADGRTFFSLDDGTAVISTTAAPKGGWLATAVSSCQRHNKTYDMSSNTDTTPFDPTTVPLRRVPAREHDRAGARRDP